MEIKLTASNKIQITQGQQVIEFDSELGTEITHGIMIAMAEAGRRTTETSFESTVLTVDTEVKTEVSAYDLDD